MRVTAGFDWFQLVENRLRFRAPRPAAAEKSPRAVFADSEVTKLKLPYRVCPGSRLEVRGLSHTATRAVNWGGCSFQISSGPLLCLQGGGVLLLFIYKKK